MIHGPYNIKLIIGAVRNFANAPKSITRGWKKRHDKALHKLYSSFNIKNDIMKDYAGKACSWRGQGENAIYKLSQNLKKNLDINVKMLKCILSNLGICDENSIYEIIRCVRFTTIPYFTFIWSAHNIFSTLKVLTLYATCMTSNSTHPTNYSCTRN